MHHLVVPLLVADVRQAAAFYVAAGLCAADAVALSDEADPRRALLQLAAGPGLRLQRCDDPAVLRYLRAQSPQLEIGQADIAALVSRIGTQLRQGDIVGGNATDCYQGPLEYPGGQALFFADPSGNRLVFMDW
ncbi:VOC family protein [Xanthomonas bundabergensis]|uniref:VOC family protein n=1 Tax=Xanthomonas bundabergensis TaxID=3160842 RepID=UPI003518B3BB